MTRQVRWYREVRIKVPSGPILGLAIALISNHIQKHLNEFRWETAGPKWFILNLLRAAYYTLLALMLGKAAQQTATDPE